MERFTTSRLLLAAGCTFGLISTSALANTVTTGWIASDYNNDGTWEVSESDVTNFAQTPNAVWDGTGTLVNASTNFTNVNAYVSNPLFDLTRPGDTSASYQELLGGESPSQVNASWELIFRPGDFTGNHVVFETGGNVNGSIIRLFDDTLNVRFQNSDTNGQEFSIDLSTVGTATDFYHLSAAFDVGAGNAGSGLYVNGVSVGAASLSPGTDVTDWVGGDGSGLGKVGGGATAGSLSYTNFGGDIALMRHYNGVLFDGSDAGNAFAAATGNRRTATMGWDAADYNEDGTWETSESDPAITGAAGITWHGTGTRQTGATNFANVNAWIDTPNLIQGTPSGTTAADDDFNSTLTPDITASDATWELVIRPDDYSGRHVLIEHGGSGNGTLIELNGSTLSFVTQNGSTSLQQVFDIDLSTIDTADQFFHIIAAVEVGTTGNADGLSGLYVNGVLVDDIDNSGGTDTAGDWAGIDGGGLGRKTGTTAFGNASYTTFGGDVAIVRIYADQAFDQAAVDASFAALVPEPSSLVLLGLGGLALLRRRR